jgi:hypothetical protein
MEKLLARLDQPPTFTRRVRQERTPVRITMHIDGLTTPQVRAVIVAHRRVTGAGNVSDGVPPRVAVEGPECWSVDTEALHPADAGDIAAILAECEPLRPHTMDRSVRDDLVARCRRHAQAELLSVVTVET